MQKSNDCNIFCSILLCNTWILAASASHVGLVHQGAQAGKRHRCFVLLRKASQELQLRGAQAHDRQKCRTALMLLMLPMLHLHQLQQVCIEHVALRSTQKQAKAAWSDEQSGLRVLVANISQQTPYIPKMWPPEAPPPNTPPVPARCALPI